MTNALTKGQEIALNQYISDYPEEKTFEEIMNILEEDRGDERLEAAEFFEDWYPPRLAEEIRTLAREIDKVINFKEE